MVAIFRPLLQTVNSHLLLSYKTSSTKGIQSLKSSAIRSTMNSSTVELVGVDKENRPRAIFLYDGACGVCKFSVGFCVERDTTDHLRFAPLQSPLAERLCKEYDMPCDLSTGILIDETGSHRDSTCILRMLLFLSFPWPWIGCLALWVPTVIRDAAYRLFARNRGAIWKKIKQVTGLGDTMMHKYRRVVLGLDEVPKPFPKNWGFDEGDEKAGGTKEDPVKEGDKKSD